MAKTDRDYSWVVVIKTLFATTDQLLGRLLTLLYHQGRNKNYVAALSHFSLRNLTRFRTTLTQKNIYQLNMYRSVAHLYMFLDRE